MVMHSGTSSRLAGLILAANLVLPGLALAQDPAAHAAGIWSIADTPGMSRWIVIHGLDTSKTTGIYHIEVIGRKTGDPQWQIVRLVPHMAITEKALRESILEPLESGAVYPEVFEDALAGWQAQNDGAGGSVCETSVTQCMQASTGEN